MKKTIFAFVLALSFNLLSSPSSVSLIWQYNRAKAWEEDWLMELLTGLDVRIIDDTEFQIYEDNSIIVAAADQEKKMIPYFEKLKEMGYKFGLILLYDEHYYATTCYFEYPLFIFRNYWHKQFEKHTHVTCFALGYKSGFWAKESQTIVSAAQRKYDWSFAGQIVRRFSAEEKQNNKQHSSRISMYQNMVSVPNHFVHKFVGWNSDKSLPVEDYQDLMLNSIFIPCPRGHWNLDSYRLSEALECGCIPIVERVPFDYYQKFFGDHPFITVNDWKEAPAKVKKLLNDPAALEQRRQQCHDWWLNYKQKLNQKFVTTIRTAFKLEQ